VGDGHLTTASGGKDIAFTLYLIIVHCQPQNRRSFDSNSVACILQGEQVGQGENIAPQIPAGSENRRPFVLSPLTCPPNRCIFVNASDYRLGRSVWDWL
jgi:hypothetical protein